MEGEVCAPYLEVLATPLITDAGDCYTYATIGVSNYHQTGILTQALFFICSSIALVPGVLIGSLLQQNERQ